MERIKIMKSKKVISSILAFTLAFGTFAALPELTDGAVDTAITASAAEYYKKVSGFVLNKDTDGDIYVSDYTGNGGNITIPKEASYIGEDAFKYNTSIKSVTFPEGTTKYGIGSNAFAWCTNLESVTIYGDIGSGDVNGIGANTFIGCHSLKKVSFKKKDAYIAYIGEGAFFSCYSLDSINLPSGTALICDQAFENCVKLKSITIPKKTKIEGGYTFGYMQGGSTSDDYYEIHNNDSTKKKIDVKADGKKTVYWEICAKNLNEATKLANKIFGSTKDVRTWGYYDDSNTFVSDEYGFCVPIKQCQITLNVYSGSPAQKWAKEHGIKYKLTSGTSTASVLDAPANLEATKTKNTVTLVWDDVKGASAYRVYIYNESKGKYEKYKDVTVSKCKITDLKAGTKYKFKVVALKKENGKYTEGEYVTCSVTTNK